MPYTYYESDFQLFEQMRIASSARCEAYFKDFKNLILKGPMRVDKVLITHLRSLAGTTKLLCAWDNKEYNRKFPCKELKSIAEIPLSASDFEPEFSSTLEGVIEPLDIHQLQSADFHRSPSSLLVPDLHKFHDLNRSLTPLRSPVLIHLNSKNDDSELLSVSKSEANEFNENSNSFLNKVDSWGGKLNEEKRKRGYHLRACPDIENKHKRPRKQCILQLLINGNSMPPVEVDKNVRLKVTNTCGFDALIHCIRAGYTNWITYHNYLEQSEHHIFQFVKLLSTLGAVRKVYEWRGKLLLKNKIPKEGILDCYGNIGSLATSLMFKEPSMHEYKICNKCDNRKETVREIMCPNLRPMYENGLEGLQESVRSLETDTCAICPICKESRRIERVGGAHLIMDIEALQWDQLALRSQFFGNRIKVFSLDTIPIDLQFGGASYKLTGAVVYVPGHYVPYIRCISGRWECHDGLTKNSRVQNLRNPKIKRTIHILFYVKVE